MFIALCWISTFQHINVSHYQSARFGAGEILLKAGEIPSNRISKCFQNHVSKCFQNHVMSLKCHFKNIQKNSFKMVPKRCFQTGFLRKFEAFDFLNPHSQFQVSSEALGFPNHGVPKAQSQGVDVQKTGFICVDGIRSNESKEYGN